LRVIDDFPREKEFSAGRATLLIDGEGWITGIARGGRRGSASDLSRNVSFDRITPISELDPDELIRAVRPRARSTADQVLASGFGLLSETASSDVRAALISIDPEASEVLESILEDEPSWMATEPELGRQHRMERDAVNVSLEIAGFNRSDALADARTPLEPAHFSFEDLVRPGEDPIIIDDLEVFPGWDRIAALRPAGRVFEEAQSGRRLTVLHANKNPIEHATGVDLVYFVHEYQSFVLVQYKRLVHESSGLLLRINKQLLEEVRRMAKLEKTFRRSTPAAELSSYRLTDSICFFKLCDADQPAEVTDLSRGRYVDLGTWSLLKKERMTVGPKGGKRLAYDDTTRYFTNSSFAQLVSEGWVGSYPESFEALMDYLFERYEMGRSLILSSLRLGSTLRRLPDARATLTSRAVNQA
jgi:hypothetical protein